MRLLALFSSCAVAYALQFSTRAAVSGRDFDQVAELKASGRSLTRRLLEAARSEEYSAEAREKTRAALRRMLCGATERGEEDALVACAEDDGRVVGTCDVGVVREGRRPRAFLRNLIVDESARRRGVATALVRDAVERARGRGLDAVTLRCENRNDGARRLYAALGFAEIQPSVRAFRDYGYLGLRERLLRLDVPPPP